MTLPDLSEDAVRKIVAPYEGRIAACLHRGFTAWLDRSDALGLSVSNRTRASFISDLITTEVDAEFLQDDRVQVMRSRGLPFLLINGTVAVRFKKFRNANHAISVGRTYQQQQISNNQLDLPGCDIKPLWLTAGYLLDATGLDAEYAMTFAEQGAVQYVFDLNQPTTLSAPVVPIMEAEDEDGLVIRSARQTGTTGTGDASS